ncbi:MAG: AMP-dependent synthetase and ligase [Bacteroidetes bacterium]|jgi:long-chain acyl-CoA synthetase|nr:AMP-dependent synthetase and ligase [Bacteroidota bacterium]
MIQENFIRLFEDSFRNNWNLPGFSNYGEELTLTYGDIAKRVARLHILFEQCKLQPNDKVALIGRNNANWAVTYIATVTYGAVVVPILQDFNPNDVHHITNHSESKLFFTSDNIWENLEEEKLTTVKAVFSLTNFNCITLLNKEPKPELAENTVYEQLVLKYLQPDYINSLFHARYPHGFHKDHVRYIDKSNDEVVSINYTSGTTGFSKGVMTSGNALAGNITFGFRTKLVGPGYRIVSFLPLAHAYGCAFDFLTPVCAGSHIHFIGKTPSPKILLAAFAEIKPSVIFCVPLIIEKIYKKQIQPLLAKPSMRWVLSIPLLDQTILTQIRKKLVDAFGGEFSEIVVGGAPMNAEVEEFFHKIKFPFTIGYGMTECAPLISYSNTKSFVPKSAGKILDIMEVKILDKDPNTGVGEICVRGENVMLGYYKNPDATDSMIDTDGWLHTGDLGTVDSDNNIFIRGRNKTMILGASGQNIYPEEIEARLNNMPYVMESLVIENNGRLIALVCPDYEAVDAEHLDQRGLEDVMEENRKMLNSVVAAYETVAKIQLYPHEFEKTPKKSIKRYLYSASFQDAKSKEGDKIGEQSIKSGKKDKNKR